MFFMGKKNKKIGYNVLSKVYFANLIVAIAVTAIFACWISWKFQDIKEELATQNDYFKNLMNNRALLIKFELDAIEKHLLNHGEHDFDEVLKNHLTDPNLYSNFYLLDSKGSILGSSDDKIDDKLIGFFAALPWKNTFYFTNGLYVSWFDADDNGSPIRFGIKEFTDGRVLVAKLTLKSIPGELDRVNKTGNTENSIISTRGTVVFHADPELMTGWLNILDMYSLEEGYLENSKIKMSNIGDEYFDFYKIGCVQNSRICILSRYPVKTALKQNAAILAFGSVVTLFSILMIFVNTRFVKNQILKPVEEIRHIVRKLEKGEEISRYLGDYYISELGEIKNGLLRIYKDTCEQKSLYLDYERKFGFLFEKGPFIIILIDAKTGEIIDASQKALEFYGFGKEEIVGKSVYDFTAARQGDIEGFSYEFGADEAVYEISQKRADGEVKDVRVNIKNIETSGGEKYGFCVVTDVTTDKLLAKNSQNSVVADAYSPVLSLVWSEGLFENIKSVSVNSERILGYGIEEILDKNFDFKKIIYPEDLEHLVSEFNLKRRVFSVSKKQQFETLKSCRIIRKDGEIVPYSLCLKFVSNGSEISEIIGYFMDSNMACKNNMMCKASSSRTKI